LKLYKFFKPALRTHARGFAARFWKDEAERELMLQGNFAANQAFFQ
jgi:hypothetical protein